MSDIDTAAADSLKVLDPKRPIREADVMQTSALVARQLANNETAVCEFCNFSTTCTTITRS